MKISSVVGVSVPSFGDSFFMVKMENLNLILVHGFRPLIRGFFFYEMQIGYDIIPIC